MQSNCSSLVAIGIVSFDGAPSWALGVRSALQPGPASTVVIETGIEGIAARYHAGKQVVTLDVVLSPLQAVSYDVAMRRLLAVFMLAQHVFWVLPSSSLTCDAVRTIRALQARRAQLPGVG